MHVIEPREKWTGDRLDGLEKKVDDGFAQVDERFKQVDKRFEQVDKRFEKVEGKIEGLDAKFDAKFDGLHKTLLGSAVSVIVTLIACCAALAGAGPF
jgi:tetrahydromethanopterin S-methyltransferase subunit G